jgi:hypothetical protein
MTIASTQSPRINDHLEVEADLPPGTPIVTPRERVRDLVRMLTAELRSLGAAGYEASANGYQLLVEPIPVDAGERDLQHREKATAEWHALIRETAAR